jgi:hypothetical protein
VKKNKSLQAIVNLKKELELEKADLEAKPTH